MCGIAGILSLSGQVSPIRLDRFTDSLAHRGPDGRGTWIGPGIGLGHRRLSILDPTDAGACPMEYRAPDGRILRITFNGEVYNFLELREELEALGHGFRSQTDTEVVVAAFAQWGPACLERFNGMWALAIWDELPRRLFLSRDRFGIKPVYFTTRGGEFAFASEIKAFVSLEGFHRELDEEMAALSLDRSQPMEGSTDRTLMKDVRKLMAGHFLEVSADGSVEVKRWWNTMDHLPEIAATRERRVERFREILMDAVSLRMRSDVPIGTCLSGGIDSSAVASCMAWLHRENASSLRRTPGEWRRAFIAAFPGTPLDETAWAMKVVEHVQARPEIWTFEQEEGLRNVLSSVWSMEDVYPGLAVPVWSLYRRMRECGVLVSLDGHGGDELLCGYTWYLDWPSSLVNRNLESDFHRTLLPSILRNYDRCSMAHGIEVRMPLMDWRLVTYSFALPAEDKIGGGFTKRVLRDACEGIMPESVRTRRSKIGFNSPMIEWFNGGFLPMLKSVTSHRRWLQSPWWNGPALRKDVLDRSLEGAWKASDWELSLSVWTKLNLVLWTRMFVDGDLSPNSEGT